MRRTKVSPLICDPSVASGAGARPAAITVAPGLAALMVAWARSSRLVYAHGSGLGFHQLDWLGSFHISQ